MSDLPHKPTIFIDRNAGGKIFRDLIVKAGIQVVLHAEYFTDDTTPDDVWLDEISRQGWIMVTGDKATMRDLLFLQKLARSKARVFFINALNGGSREEKAQCVINAYEKMLKICREREPPLFWQFNRGGEVVAVDFRAKLGMLRRRANQTRQP
jgi:PIN like domain